MKNFKQILGAFVLSQLVVSCGGKSDPNASPYYPSDVYAGCVIPAGQKFRTVIGNFNEGVLKLDLFYGDSGVTDIVGDLQINSIESLFSTDASFDPYDPPTRFKNERYHVCVASAGYPAFREDGSSIQELDFSLQGNNVYIETSYPGSTWLGGDSLLGQATLDLEGYPETTLTFN